MSFSQNDEHRANHRLLSKDHLVKGVQEQGLLQKDVVAIRHCKDKELRIQLMVVVAHILARNLIVVVEEQGLQNAVRSLDFPLYDLDDAHLSFFRVL